MKLTERLREMSLPQRAKLALGVLLTASLLLPGIVLLGSDEESDSPGRATPAARPAAALPKPPAKNATAQPRKREARKEIAALPPGPEAVAAAPGPSQPALDPDAPAASELRAIGTSTNGGRSVIELRADGAITNADVIPITGPDRLVIDLPDLRSAMEATELDADSDRVGRVRIGQHDGKVRVVLDTGRSGKDFEDRAVEPTAKGLRIILGKPGALAKTAPEPEPLPAAGDAPPFQPVASLAPDDPPPPVQAVPDRSKLPLYLKADEAGGPGTGSEAGLNEEYDCIIEPFEVVEVGSALTAVVDSVSVERSDYVETGQVLAQLESSPERATVAVAQARAKMNGELTARRARMDLGSRKRDRADQLFQSEALSADLRDEIRTEAEVAKAVVQEARERKKLMELEFNEAIERLDEHTIRSPVTGVVVDRLKSPGEVVKEETILVVAQIDPLRVEVILPAAAFGSVQPGMRAEVIPELPNAGVQLASVKLVDRVVDGTSGTFGVRLELPNADHAVPSGLRCQVRFLRVD